MQISITNITYETTFGMFTMHLFSSTSKNETHSKTSFGVTIPLYESTTKKNSIKVRNIQQRYIHIISTYITRFKDIVVMQ